MHCATLAACHYNLDGNVENEEWTRGLKIFRDLFFAMLKNMIIFFIVHQDDEKQ